MCRATRLAQLADLPGKGLDGLDGFRQGLHGGDGFLARGEVAVDYAGAVASGQAGAVDANMGWFEKRDGAGQEAFDLAGMGRIRRQ